jgi:hypothetical protein
MRRTSARGPSSLCAKLLLLCVTVRASAPSHAGADDGDEQPVHWMEAVDVAVGNGHAGPWRMNVSSFDYVDDPSAALRDDGVTGIVWADNRRQDIFFQRFDARGRPGLRAPVNVSTSPDTFSWLPRIVMTDQNEVFVLWQEIVFSGGSHGGEIYFARSRNGGRSFERPVNLSNTAAGAGKGRLTEQRWDNGSLDLVQGPDGVLYAAWSEYEGRLHVARSDDGGRTFSEPVLVNRAHMHSNSGDGDPPPAARGPSLAVSSDGALYVVWTTGNERAAAIHLAMSTDDGQTFTSPRVLVEGVGHADAPQIAVDSGGTLHLVHAESPGGLATPTHIQYTRLEAPDADVELPRAIAGPPALGPDEAGFPSIALDGDGRVYIVWEHYPAGERHPIGLGFALSRDRGMTFSDPTLVPGTSNSTLGVNGSRQGKLMRKLAVSRDGDIAVVNSLFRANESSRIRWVRGVLREP